MSDDVVATGVGKIESVKREDNKVVITTPKGITLKSLNGNAFDAIAPQGTAQIVAVLNADSTADGSGSFGGKLVYTDAS